MRRAEGPDRHEVGSGRSVSAFRGGQVAQVLASPEPLFYSERRNLGCVEQVRPLCFICWKVVLHQRELDPRLSLEVQEIPDGGAVRLKLTGDLDLGTAPVLKARLRELAAQQCHVRLDLSELEFMDSTGIHALIDATNHARADGWRFEIEPDVSRQVRRLFELVHFEPFLSGEATSGA